jgi:hypothetical protein
MTNKLINDVNITGSVTATNLRIPSTVGSGQEYATVAAAFNDGKNFVRLVGTVTETSTPALTGNVKYTILIPKSCEWILNDYGLQCFNPDTTVEIIGENGTGKNLPSYNSSITVNYTTRGLSVIEFDTFGAPPLDVDSGSVTVKNVLITDTSAVDRTTTAGRHGFTNCVNQTWENVHYILPNQNFCGIYVSGVTGASVVGKVTINNVTFVGGGTGCWYALYCDGDGTGTAHYNISNVRFLGSFGNDIIFRTSTTTSCFVNDIFSKITNGPATFQIGGTVNNVRDDSSGVANLYQMTGTGGISNFGQTISNMNCPEQTLIIDSLDATITNCYFVALGTGGPATFTNCLFSDPVTLNDIVGSGRGWNCGNCTFATGVTIDSDDTTLTGCICGFVESPGNSYTITVNAGIDRTIIVGCRTDDTIVDNGTGTVPAGNVVY